MTAVNTKTTLDTMFKYVVADKVNSLIPDTVELLRTTRFDEAEKIGRKYLVPVALTFENGVTYGDKTAFALNDPIAGVYEEIEMDSNPVVLRSQVSQAAANAMVKSDKAFATWAYLRSQNMMKSLAKRAEIAMWYGQTGLGKVSASSVSTNATVTITDATWAPGIWSGMEGAAFDVYNGGSKINTNADCILVSVDYDNKQIVLSGNATDLGNIAATHDIFFKGAKSNDMAGVDKIMTNTGSLFGIDASAYALWKANSYSAGSAALSMSKVLKALAAPVGKGGLDEDVNLYVATKTYENLNSDFGALRSLDQSYSKSAGQNGVQRIEYFGQNGKISIIPVSFIKEGEAFLMPPKQIKRVGTTDLTFATNGPHGEEFFLPLASSAGYELRCQYDFSVMIEKPAQCTKISSIVNS